MIDPARNPLTLANFELRRFRGPLPRIALAFILLVPLLYGCIYLAGNWDPYGRLDQVPVAVVNHDVPTTVNDKPVTAGDDFVESLHRAGTFDFRDTDDAEAADGLAHGRYYMVITVPDDFSARLVSGQGDHPQRAGITLRRNDANGFVIGTITNSAQNSIARALDETTVRSYFEAVFANLATIREGMLAASDGAAQLDDGARKARDGSVTLDQGLATAADGGRQLATRLDDLQAGAGRLATGATQVADGTQQIADVVDPVLSVAVDDLPAIQQRVGEVSARAAELTASVSGGTDSLAHSVDSALTSLDAVLAAHPDLAGDPALAALRGHLKAADTRTDALAARAGKVATDAAAANERIASAGDLSVAARDAKAKVDQLNDGAHQVAAGASELRDGAGRAASASHTLSDGLGQLAGGAHTLRGGLDQLATGTGELAGKLTEGASRLPVLTPEEASDAAQVLAAPVDVAMEVDNPAHVYGRGLAPMFFSIALWVLGISAFFLVRPITGRVIAGRASDLRIAITAWLPLAGISVGAGWLMLAAAWIGLGLDPVHPVLMIVTVTVVALAFSSVAHLLRTALGLVSTAALLVLLIIQLTAAGGTYPPELLPPFFASIGHLMPMTYTIDAFRIVISGGLMSSLVRDLTLMGVLAASCLALLVLVVHRKRRFSMTDLHPLLG
ncbi:MAG: YhgE/Pip domain-containing protein [Propioniciclava sp.]|uniref:YhgE/Pip family protein n=1 Tax=Propioniciclava sp. TaxID=2038686 RepID=UPI0039E34E3B